MSRFNRSPMIRKTYSAEQGQASPAFSHESLERRVLLSAGGNNLFAGTGTGTFGTAASLNVPKVAGAKYTFAVGDFNGDSSPDIVVEGGKAPKQTATTPGGRQLLLMLNSGTGTFAAPTAVPIAMRQVV